MFFGSSDPDEPLFGHGVDAATVGMLVDVLTDAGFVATAVEHVHDQVGVLVAERTGVDWKMDTLSTESISEKQDVLQIRHASFPSFEVVFILLRIERLTWPRPKATTRPCSCRNATRSPSRNTSKYRYDRRTSRRTTGRTPELTNSSAWPRTASGDRSRVCWSALASDRVALLRWRGCVPPSCVRLSPG